MTGIATSTAAFRSPSAVRSYDGFAVFWVVLWLVVGVWTGYRLWQLASISDNVVQSGRALDRAGQALQEIGRVPVIGDAPERFAGRVRATAQNVVAQGEVNGDRTRQLAVLLGVTIAAGPSLPLLALYLPARRRYAGEVRAVRAAYEGGRGPAVAALLARRAVNTLPLDELLAASPDPDGDVRSGRHRALAEAELIRLGLRDRPPAPDAGTPGR